jgi:hypothetical protein
MRLYKQATPKKYDFAYMKLSKNPPEIYHNFKKMIATGGEVDEDAEEVVE